MMSKPVALPVALATRNGITVGTIAAAVALRYVCMVNAAFQVFLSCVVLSHISTILIALFVVTVFRADDDLPGVLTHKANTPHDDPVRPPPAVSSGLLEALLNSVVGCARPST